MQNPEITPIASGAFLAILSLFFTSCAAHHYDPGYKELVSKIETNPPPDAIVGWWHRKADGKVGGLMPFTTYLTLLFKEDGTGLSNFQGEGIGSSDFEDTAIPFTWTYKPGGVWVQYPKGKNQLSRIEWRMADDHLIRVSEVNVMGSRDTTYIVLTRLKQ